MLQLPLGQRMSSTDWLGLFYAVSSIYMLFNIEKIDISPKCRHGSGLDEGMEK